MNTNFLNFDQLYSNTCEDLRRRKSSEQVLQCLKSAASDWDRVKIILSQNLDVVKLFRANIGDFFEPKDENRSIELLKTACEEKSIDLMNQALRLCPFLNDIKILSTSVDVGNPSVIKEFLDDKKRSSKSGMGSGTIAHIFNERSKIFYDQSSFEYCIRDIIRSVDFGEKKTYDMALRMGLSYKSLRLFSESKLIFLNALELLRQSSLDNECKSKATMFLVNHLKEIQQKLQNSALLLDPPKIKQGQQISLDNLCVYGGLNSHLAGCSNLIELRYSEDRGRHIVATKTIPPGSTLIIESPYAWSVSPKEYAFHCQFCMESSVNGIPCPTCSSVMFCSEVCLRNASQVFNLKECKILKLLDSSEKLGSMALLCFRTIAQTPLSTLKEEYEKSLPETSPMKTSLGFNEDVRLDSSNYSSVFAQTTNSQHRNGGDLLKRTYAAIYLTICLEFIGYFHNAGEIDKGKLSEEEEMVSGLVLRHLQSASCNAYGVNYVSKPIPSTPLEINEIGGATYPIISTTNHSCNPNAYRFNIGRTCVVKSLVEIMQGEEVLDSYGPLYTISPRWQRLQELENQYLFKCACQACLHDWQTYKDLRSCDFPKVYKCPNCITGRLDLLGGGSKYMKKCFGCAKVTDLKKVQKLLKTAKESYMLAKVAVLEQRNYSLEVETWICNYILTMQKILFIPCMEIVEAQEILKLYWNLRVKTAPL